MRIDGVWWSWILIEVLHHNSHGRICMKRGYTGHHLIEDDPEGIEIAAWIIIPALSLFWCHILRCPYYTSGYCTSCGSVLASNPKIGKNRLAHWSYSRYSLIKQNISRFDI